MIKVKKNKPKFYRLIPKEFQNSDLDKYYDAIAQVYHPNSEYRNYEYHESKQIVATDVLNNPNFDWDSIQPLITLYLKHETPKAHTYLINWQQELEERHKFLKNIKYDQSTPMDLLELKEKWLKDTHYHWKNYEKIVNDITKSKDESKSKGDAEDSLTDSNAL